MTDGAREIVLQAVRNETSPADPWTSDGKIHEHGRQNGLSKQQVSNEIDQALVAGDLLEWHGLLTLREPDHLRGVIEAERNATITRKILIGKCNRALSSLRESQSSEVAADV